MIDRRAKIKAIADDPRGNEAMRERAREWLARHPEPIAKPGVVPGVTPSPEWIAWRKSLHVPRKN